MTKPPEVYCLNYLRYLQVMVLVIISSGLYATSFAQDSELRQDATQSPISTLVHKALSPYLTHPERRDPRERVISMDRKVEIWRLESFERGQIEQKLCRAVRALIFGRLSTSRGVNFLFQDAPYLDVVELVFYRVKTEVHPDLSGAYQQTQRPLVTARLSIARAQAIKLNIEVLQSTLKGPTCLTQARDFLDDLWIADETTKRREKLRNASLEMRSRSRSTSTPQAQPSRAFTP
jgi:hypothetical protein